MPFKQGVALATVILLLAATGCSNSRRIFSDEKAGDYSIRADRLIGEVYRQNLSERDFEITKLRMKIGENGNSHSFSGFLKHNNKGDILVSVRTIAGIEAVRILINRDSIRINDRLNRKYSHGSTQEILARLGADWKDLGLLFGDITNMKTGKDNLLCQEGYAEMKIDNGERGSMYRIDCEKKKLSWINIYNRRNNLNMFGQYGEYQSVENMIYPSSIKIILSDKYYIDLEIERLEIVKDPEIRFSAGKGYETIIIR